MVHANRNFVSNNNYDGITDWMSLSQLPPFQTQISQKSFHLLPLLYYMKKLQAVFSSKRKLSYIYTSKGISFFLKFLHVSTHPL